MQNVYDELINKRLIHIISDSHTNHEVPNVLYKDTAIAVNLFYEDTLRQYFAYLDNVPKEIEIYIYSSNENALNEIARYADRRENVFFFKKENRGRDISAFLVAFKDIALKKKYLCFLHDKKEKHPSLKIDVDYWIENLWGNTLFSKLYIDNVLGLLGEEKVGILTPPIPFANEMPYWYSGAWCEDFEITRKLVERLQLNCNIEKQKTPITLGSVCWCKTAAIKKILEYGWKYEDFQEEPMRDDGTISHAIERIFAFVAQDAGYTTEWIMCTKYAESLVLKLQCQMEETFGLLKQNFSVDDLQLLRKFNCYRERIKVFCGNCKRVYIYGAGIEGKRIANWMHFWKLNVEGFVVTKQSAGQHTVLDIPVYKFDDVEDDGNVGIIIAVSSKYCSEIEHTVKKRGIKYCMPLAES